MKEIDKKLMSYQIKEYIDNYLIIQRDSSDNTVSTYSYGLLEFIKYLGSKSININTFKVKEITVEMGLEFIEYLRKKGNAAKTINNRMTSLKSFLEYVSYKEPEILEICRQFKMIKRLKEEEKIHKYYTKEELKLLLEAVKENFKYYCILSVLYDCGLRSSELTNLKKEDVILDQNNPRIMIEKSKNNKSRVVILSNVVAKILKEYLKEYKPESEYVFVNRYKNKYTSSGIEYIFKTALKLAKEKCNDNTMFTFGGYPHLLRHSKGVHLVDAGTSLINIRDLLGHSTMKSTEIYARTSTEKKKEILEKNSLSHEIKIKRKKREILDLENYLKNKTKTK